METIPPPPGQEDTPAAPARRRHYWKKIGGDGLLVSVGFHLLLGLVALFYIGKAVARRPVPTETAIFRLPGDRGDNGEKPGLNPATRARMPRLTAPHVRIASSRPGADIMLPDTAPKPSGFELATAGGDIAKGFGGPGTGGMNGTGTGPGSVAGFFGRFVPSGMRPSGLVGRFYDGKQKPDGRPSAYAANDAASDDAFTADVLRRFCGGPGRPGNWNEEWLTARFFRAPERLVAGSLFIPHRPADAAPEAYGVADRVQGRRWLAHYRGIVTAPKSGRFRFWGLADDVMVVRWDGRVALDSGWTVLGVPGGGHAGNLAAAAKKTGGDVTATRQGRPGAPFRAGRWIEVVRGRDYPVDVVISEIPGGRFGAWLMMEEAGPDGSGDGTIFLMRFNTDTLPDGLTDDTGLAVDMSGKGLVWKTRAASNGTR